MATPSNPSSSSTSSSSSSSSSSYDLTSIISPFLDRHMIIPLIEYLEEKLFYPSEQLLAAKYSIAEKTKMVDFAYGFYKQLYNKEPEEAEEKRKKVYGELKEGEEACGPLIDLLKDFEKVAELRKTSNFTLPYLMEHEKVTESHLEALWSYARLCFDIGRYRDSADYLSVFRLLCPDLSDPRKFSAQWGKLAAEILMTNWDTAYNDLLSLKESIDNRVFVSHTEQLQQRTWLLHWSLFIFFKIEDGRTLFIEFLLNDEKLLNVISSAAPHILRYLSAAVIMHRRRTKTLQEVCRILNTEKQGTGGKSGYSDPITELLLLTCNDFNFESSYNTLHLCPALIDQDYFLSSHKQLFLDGAKMLIFETYCRIHKAIQIDTLAKHCDWQGESKEEKLVEAVKLARVDARIDMKKQQLIVATPYPTVYQQLIDKTKSFVYRSSQLTQSIDKRIAQIKSEQRDQMKERSD